MMDIYESMLSLVGGSAQETDNIPEMILKSNLEIMTILLYTYMSCVIKYSLPVDRLLLGSSIEGH